MSSTRWEGEDVDALELYIYNLDLDAGGDILSGTVQNSNDCTSAYLIRTSGKEISQPIRQSNK